MSILEAKNISYKYGNGGFVLQNFSYSFYPGRVYAMLGASGTGKTTLLSLIAGLDICRDGSVLFNGEDIKTLNRYKYRAEHVGMIFQQFNLFYKFNALENVLISMNVSKYKAKPDNKSYAIEILDKFGIDEVKRRRKVIELSGGEQQRVAFARAIAHKPQIILADEPTSNLDESNRALLINDLLNAARAEDRCIIISTHQQEVAGVCDECINL